MRLTPFRPLYSLYGFRYTLRGMKDACMTSMLDAAYASHVMFLAYVLTSTVEGNVAVEGRVMFRPGISFARALSEIRLLLPTRAVGDEGGEEELQLSPLEFVVIDASVTGTLVPTLLRLATEALKLRVVRIRGGFGVSELLFSVVVSEPGGDVIVACVSDGLASDFESDPSLADARACLSRVV